MQIPDECISPTHQTRGAGDIDAFGGAEYPRRYQPGRPAPYRLPRRCSRRRIATVRLSWKPSYKRFLCSPSGGTCHSDRQPHDCSNVNRAAVVAAVRRNDPQTAQDIHGRHKRRWPREPSELIDQLERPEGCEAARDRRRSTTARLHVRGRLPEARRTMPTRFAHLGVDLIPQGLMGPHRRSL